MSKSTETAAAVNPVAATPTVHLLPLNLGGLADHADPRRSGGRFALGGVRIEFKGDTFVAEATDTKQLVRIEGECVAGADDYPVGCVPGLATAPNGETAALVPVASWRKAFAAAGKIRGVRVAEKRGHVTGAVACVVGRVQTTFGATDTEVAAVEQTANIEGRFPPADRIIDDAMKAAPAATVAFDPKLLAEVLKTAAEFCDGDGMRVEFHIPPQVDGRGEPTDRPCLVRATGRTGKLTAVVMPLAPR